MIARMAGFLLSLLSVAVSAQAQIFPVPAELWDRPRSARAVMEQAGVKQAVDLYLAQSAAKVAIHHGLGQEPLLQAEELRAWLIALAVDSGRITLVNDLKPGEPLKLEIVTGK